MTSTSSPSITRTAEISLPLSSARKTAPERSPGGQLTKTHRPIAMEGSEPRDVRVDRARVGKNANEPPLGNGARGVRRHGPVVGKTHCPRFRGFPPNHGDRK